jgi:ubiquinone/menaquinone biosynthesis C-methylase UbiE
MDLESRALGILERAGIEEGQIVLDFGCGSGTYAIPAARIVGEKGKVYALDKDNKSLNELMQKAESAGLKNIERIDARGDPKVNLADNSVDVVLLFDVLHPYYFPEVDDRRKVLDEVHRVSKAKALILVYPKHMESEAKNEVENANFCLESEYSGTLIHDNKNLEKGKVLIFTKR